MFGTIAHYELCTTVEFIAVFLANIMPQIHDIIFVLFCFGRKLNRADSKHSCMTVTRIQTLYIYIFFNCRILKDIVWTLDFKDTVRINHTFVIFQLNFNN
jgi:hypothetical protein